jgi:hypothetical protein
MTNFSKTYGMAGIGIAAAVGFVFALSYLSPSGAGLNQTPLQEQPSQSTFSLRQDNSPQPPSSSDNTSGDGASSTFSAPADQGTSKIESSRLNNSDSGLALTSLVALTGSHEVIGEVSDGLEFKPGVPVFIQVNLQNSGVDSMSDLTIILDVKPQGENANENIAEFHGDVNAGSAASIESYWQPTSAGDYLITVMTISGGELASTIPAAPIAAIHVRVA